MKIVNKKILIILFSSLFLFSIANALLNPSAVYCEAMNYTYFSKTIPEGEVGYCKVAIGIEVDAWDFYMGKSAQDYSYCKKMGYGIKVINDAVYCILPDKTEKDIVTLMNLSFEETTCGDGSCGLPENYLSCPVDCPSASYDGYCDGIADNKCDEDCIDFETPEKDKDCPLVQSAVCGNKQCESNETYYNCCVDCGCLEGLSCVNNKCITQKQESKCGDGICDLSENYNICSTDCHGLADGYCDKVADNICDPDCIMENDADCISCGNGICNENENYLKCATDCKTGAADKICDGIEDNKCDPDCKNNEDKDCKKANWLLISIASLIIVIVIIIILMTSVKRNE